MKVLVLFYSVYGHIYKMAKAVAEGAKKVDGAEVVIKKVPETLPDEVLEKIGAKESQKAWDHIPVAEPTELADYDAIIVGTPTRFGNMCGQMRQFWDGTGPLWANNSLTGKVGSVFTSSNTQHGGQETTIISTMITMLHQGLVVAGLPYDFKGQSTMDEISGGSPYGASTIAGADGKRQPSENELNGARHQGQYVAELAKKLTLQEVY